MLSASSGCAQEQTMAQQRHQRLGTRIDAQALAPERHLCAVMQQCLGRQLLQQRFVNAQRQRGVAARHRMTDPVALAGIEEQNLIGLGDSLIAPQMAGEDTAIRKHKFGGARAFLGALMAAISSAAHIAHRDAIGMQQGPGGKFRRGRFLRHQVSSIESTRSG
jgi:hypothetical protein